MGLSSLVLMLKYLNSMVYEGQKSFWYVHKDILIIMQGCPRVSE